MKLVNIITHFIQTLIYAHKKKNKFKPIFAIKKEMEKKRGSISKN